MKKRKILNICMVLTIILVIACGIMAVGSVKGWFGGSQTASDMSISEKTGIAMIERSGVAYELTTGTPIREGDKLYTKTAAALTVASADTSAIYMGANSSIVLNELQKDIHMEVLNGETLVDARALENAEVLFGKNKITLGQAVAAISKQAGSAMVYVYSGNIVFCDEASKETSVASGNVLSIVDGSDCKVTKMSANSLSDTQMTQLAKCDMDETFCFQLAELQAVKEMREAEILAARQEAIKQKEAEKKANASTTTTVASASTGEVQNNTTSSSSVETSTSAGIDEASDSYVENIEIDDVEQSTEGEEETSSLTCTIKIVCDTILDNMENLTAGKEGYVPSSGTILGTTSVSFSEGETVFEVLQRVCDSADIQLEYSYTPMYESYYIEGINHLYEFDCGNESGWMYKVNGWFPNYGCSQYTLEDGDTIVWCYTCNGLGADVGGTMY